MSTTTPMRTVTADFAVVEQVMRRAASTIRTELDKYKHLIDPAARRSSAQLAELLDHLADDMADGKATEVRIHGSAPAGQSCVADDHGHGQTNHTWTAALQLARTIAGGLDNPEAYRLTDASFGITGSAE